MMDVAFVVLGISLGFACCYWSYRLFPAPPIYCISVYLLMCCLAFIITTLSSWFDWWQFTSPTLGQWWSILLTNLLYYPPYAVAQAILLRNFWSNILLTLAVAGLLTLGEYLIHGFSSFVVYHHWNFGFTFLSYLVPYTLVWLFASKIKTRYLKRGRE